MTMTSGGESAEDARAEARAAMDAVLGRGVLGDGLLGDRSLENNDTDLAHAERVRAIAHRGETAAELAGFADALRARAVKIPLSEEERLRLVDSCGTGGDRFGTFNISTAAALVASAAGAWVAKHGNRGMTSRCGSADVLEAMGIPLLSDPAAAAESLRSLHFAFLYAPAMHPALKRVQRIRRELQGPTVFNLLGPLANPAGARRQVLGVYDSKLLPRMAEALALLGAEHALVVHGVHAAVDESEAEAGGSRGLDEITLGGSTIAVEVKQARGQGGGVFELLERSLAPEDFGLVAAGSLRSDFPTTTSDSAKAAADSAQSALAGGDAAANAKILEGIFRGESAGDWLPRRQIVLANAAAVLWIGGVAADLREGVERAVAAIDSGATMRLVGKLRSFPR